MSVLSRKELRLLHRSLTLLPRTDKTINTSYTCSLLSSAPTSIQERLTHRQLSELHTQVDDTLSRRVKDESDANRKKWLISLGVLGSSLLFVWLKIRDRKVQLKNEMPLLGSSSGPNEASEEPKENEADKKKKKTGFRDQKVIEYENRIKLYSTPDKIFRYYATLQVGKEKEVYMTPADFVRSIIPDSKQPEGLGLDKFKMFDPETDSCVDELEIGEDSFFHKLGQQGLISFSDYVFLLTVLSTPAKNFEFAFKVFDINGDGVVEHHEFEQVASVIRASGSVGKRHRDHKTTGNVIKKGSGGVSSALATYFFGPNLDQKLSIGDFLKFQQELHRGVLELECKKQCKEGDSMSEKQFSKLLLMYLQQSQGRKKEMLNRINKLYGRKNSQDQQDNPVVTERIPLEDVYAFWDVLTRLNEVEHAITFWTLSGAPIDKDTFKHVTRIVGKRELNEHLVEVLFQLFDDNGDGMLTHQEFFDVMKRRVWRNLRRRRDMGLHRLLSACGTCLKTTDFLTPLKKTIGWN